jgi:hypothetical protein
VCGNHLVFPSQKLVGTFAIPGDQEVPQADVAALGIGRARLQDLEEAHSLRQNRLQDFQLLHVYKLERLYTWIGQKSLTRQHFILEGPLDPIKAISKG